MGWLHQLINFDNVGTLLPLVSSSILAGCVLGLIAGLIGPMIQARDMAFAVHGTSEISFAGAAAALFLGADVVNGAVVGSVVAALILGLLGARARARNSIIGVMLPFGLGLGVLFLALYRGRSSNKLGLLAGQIVAVDNANVVKLCIVAAVVALLVLPIWRPLLFASVDPQVAAARGVRTRLVSMIFMLALGLTVALAVQLVGALLVLSLLITPAAAAARVTVRPLVQVLLSMLFAVVAAVGGILMSLGPGLPISPYVTTISFLIYALCALLGLVRERRGWNRRTA